jgi:hypothetical protein
MRSYTRGTQDRIRWRSKKSRDQLGCLFGLLFFPWLWDQSIFPQSPCISHHVSVVGAINKVWKKMNLRRRRARVIENANLSRGHMTDTGGDFYFPSLSSFCFLCQIRRISFHRGHVLSDSLALIASFHTQSSYSSIILKKKKTSN